MEKKIPFGKGKNNIFGPFAADPFPQNLRLERNGFENLGGMGGGGRGVENSNRPPLVCWLDRLWLFA